MKREFERRYETAAEVGKRCAEARRRGEQVWLGRRFVLFEITPATIAKRRLKEIIAADRSAVPCGRWVKVSDRGGRLPTTAAGWEVFWTNRARWERISAWIAGVDKPRYRLEFRR